MNDSDNGSDREKIQSIINDYLYNNPMGSEYKSMMEYLQSEIKEGKVELSEEYDVQSFRVSGNLGNMVQSGEILRIHVYPEAYIKFYDKEPVDVSSNRANVYFHKEHSYNFEKLKELHRRAEIRKDIEIGLTDVVKGKIVSSRLLELTSKIENQKEFMEVVSWKEVKKFEREIMDISIKFDEETKKIQKDAARMIEDLALDSISEIVKKYRIILDELESQYDKVDEIKERVSSEKGEF